MTTQLVINSVSAYISAQIPENPSWYWISAKIHLTSFRYL